MFYLARVTALILLTAALREAAPATPSGDETIIRQVARKSRGGDLIFPPQPYDSAGHSFLSQFSSGHQDRFTGAPDSVQCAWGWLASRGVAPAGILGYSVRVIIGFSSGGLGNTFPQWP